MIKIDIISGFLGVGKTTFANMLLRYYMDVGFRPVYIVNEFGQTGLDAEIIKADGFEAVELEGGCICCSLKGDVSTSIIKVIAAYSPTHIVFEPSGIFVFDNFFDILREPEIQKQCELGHVFTVVDSVNFNFAKVNYGSFIYNQIKNAEIILLSKLEKTNQPVEGLICDIKNISPDVFIMSKVWSEWDNADFATLLEGQYQRTEYNSHHHSHFKTVTIKVETSFSQAEMERFLVACKAGIFGQLYRIKGIVMVEKQKMLLNIALQDVKLEKFKGIAEPSLTFIGDQVEEKVVGEYFTKRG